MAKRKILARDVSVEINTGTSATPTWIPILGLSELTWQPGESTERADTTTFESNGNAEHLVAQRGRALEMVGKYIVDRDTGERDPGQEAVETAADGIGDASLKEYRMTVVGNGASKIFEASVELGEMGGEVTDARSWGATLTVSGPVNPVVEGTP